MFKTAISIFLSIALVAPATAQEQAPRTWIGGGIRYTHSTVNDADPAIAGAYIDAAYDLRHGFQGRFTGEYLWRPTNPNLFTGYDRSVRTTSQLNYAGALVGYLPVEALDRIFVGGGISTIRHFFTETGRASSYRSGAPYELYNSSVNPMAVAGARLGRNSEVVGRYYFPDTYSYSGLRGFGGEFSYTRKVSGYLHLRAGVSAKYLSYREGNQTRRREAGEVGGYVGFQFQ